MSEDRQTLLPEDSPDFAQDLNWSRKNSMVLAIGLFLLAAGYLALWLVRHDATVGLERLSSLLIMAGYITVFASVIVGDDRKTQNQINDRDS